MNGDVAFHIVVGLVFLAFVAGFLFADFTR
jgi:hypothetical protein